MSRSRSAAPRAVHRRVIAAGAVGACTVAFLATAPATATFSGQNGRIAFERFTGPDSSQVAIVGPHGRHLQNLTDFRVGAGGPDFSPRGGRIVFEHLYDDKPGALFSMRTGGKGTRRLSSGCRAQCLEDTEAAYSPDGRQIVFSRIFGPVVDDNASEIDLMVMRRNGTQVRTVKRFGDLNKHGLEPHGTEWSPDGTRLALMLLNPSSPTKESAIFTLDLGSGNLDQVTPWRLNAGNPDWSPGGGRILFNSNFEGQAAAKLFTVDPDGSDLRVLTDNRGRSYFEPVWSPNGRQVAFVAAGRHVAPHIVRMRLGGQERHRVTSSSSPGVHPDWGRRP